MAIWPEHKFSPQQDVKKTSLYEVCNHVLQLKMLNICADANLGLRHLELNWESIKTS